MSETVSVAFTVTREGDEFVLRSGDDEIYRGDFAPDLLYLVRQTVEHKMVETFDL